MICGDSLYEEKLSVATDQLINKEIDSKKKIEENKLKIKTFFGVCACASLVLGMDADDISQSFYECTDISLDESQRADAIAKLINTQSEKGKFLKLLELLGVPFYLMR